MLGISLVFLFLFCLVVLVFWQYVFEFGVYVVDVFFGGCLVDVCIGDGDVVLKLVEIFWNWLVVLVQVVFYYQVDD